MIAHLPNFILNKCERNEDSIERTLPSGRSATCASGSSSGVEHQLPKLRVAGSNPVSRSWCVSLLHRTPQLLMNTYPLRGPEEALPTHSLPDFPVSETGNRTFPKPLHPKPFRPAGSGLDVSALGIAAPGVQPMEVRPAGSCPPDDGRLEDPHKKAPLTHVAGLCSGGGRTRTYDLRVMSPTSYQLLHPAI